MDNSGRDASQEKLKSAQPKEKRVDDSRKPSSHTTERSGHVFIRNKMRNTPVEIIRGPHAGKYGRIHTTQYDHGIQNTTYTVLFPGQPYTNHIDCYSEGTPDEYVTLPAGDCAIYFNVGSYVRVATGPWSRYHGKVTACKWNAEDKYYAVRICISEDQFETHWSDYMPHDVHETFPAHLLTPY